MTALWDTIQTALWNVFHRPGLSDIIDILIVTVIIYFLLMMTRQTRASAVLKGLVVLLIATFVSDLLGLTALNWLLMSVVNNGAVSYTHLDVYKRQCSMWRSPAVPSGMIT